MSPNEVEITQVMPKSLSAHGACSREEPQPKLSPATRILALRYADLLSTKSGFSLPSSRYRFSAKRPLPSPVRLIVLRYCLGMIMSVSTLIIFSGAATPSNLVNFSMGAARLPVSCFVSGHRGRFVKCSRAPVSAGAAQSRHARLDRRHVIVGETEMVADLVHQHMGDDRAQ